MNHYAGWKNALIVFFLFISTLYAIPNLYGSDLAIQITGTGDYVIQEKDLKSVNETLSENNVDYKSATIENNNVLIRFSDSKSQLTSKALLKDSLNRNYVIALNLAPSIPQWLSSLGGRAMSLGLDLRGGVHFLLEVDMNAVTAMAMDRYYNELRTTLRKDKLYKKIRKDEDILLVSFKTEELKNEAKKVIKSDLPDLIIAEGSEQALELGLEISSSARSAAKLSALKQNITTLRNRVNELGVAEPIIQQQGQNRIVVQLPGVQDTAKAKDIIGRTALLEMRLVDDEASPADIDQAIDGDIPFGRDLFYDRNQNPLLLKKDVILTGENINNAGPGVDSQTGQSIVSLNLDSKGANIFKKITRDNIGKRIAILLIEKNITEIITAPVIKSEIGGGRVQITGMKNAQEATDVSLLLRAGSLAAPMEIIEERTVGPSMGKENIQRGIQSTFWGFIAVIILISIYYMLFGIFSSIALSINLVLLVALLSTIQATLTLPGLAAMALTVGMAIDSNVLINERIRDEIRNGNTPQASIHLGYEKAWGTILDSNITTLIAGIALFMFGTGPIKGFAVVHVLGILTSMFSAILVSRALVNFFYGSKRKIDKLNIGEIYKVNN